MAIVAGAGRVQELSKRLSWLLRHGAGEERLAMDAAGWVAIADVLSRLGMDRATLDAVVRENDKSRLEIDGARVRACQGHSRDGMPVTREALEASWKPFVPAGPLWHGTNVGAVPGIAKDGILPGARTHVHLAEQLDSRVGKRANVDVMLEVSVVRLLEAEIMPYRSPNGVVLVRRVPASAIVGLCAMTARGRRVLSELEALLGLR